MADAFKIEDESDGTIGEKEHIVDDLAITGTDKVAFDSGIGKVGKLFAEKGLPFLSKDKHESSIACWGVDGSKRHDIEGVELALRAGEAKLVAVGLADGDLVEARFGVDADPI